MTAKTAKTVKSDENPPISGKTTAFPVSDLRLFARNPRKGNIGAIAASLVAHSQYRPIVANIGTYTGRKHEVLAGNHTVAAFRYLVDKHPTDARWRTILVHWVDLDAEQAARVVLVDNRSAENGGYATNTLAGLLYDVSHDYAGLGYTAVDRAQLTPDFAVDIDVDSGAMMDLGDALADTGATLDHPRPPSPPRGDDPPPPPSPPPSIDDAPPGGPADNGPVPLTFTVVFENPAQKAAWAGFLAWLARIDPDATTVERLVGYLEKVLSRQVQEDEQA